MVEKKSRSALYVSRHRKGKLESSARGINLKERRLRAVELRKAGKNEQVIASELGISVRTLQRDLAAAIEGIAAKTTATAAELLQLEVQKLDEAEAAIHPQVLKGDQDAVRTLCRIVDLRSRLNGLQRESVQTTLVNVGDDSSANRIINIVGAAPNPNDPRFHDPPLDERHGWQDPPAQRFVALPPHHDGPQIDSNDPGFVKPLVQEPAPSPQPTGPTAKHCSKVAYRHCGLPSPSSL